MGHKIQVGSSMGEIPNQWNVIGLDHRQQLSPDEMGYRFHRQREGDWACGVRVLGKQLGLRISMGFQQNCSQNLTQGSSHSE